MIMTGFGILPDEKRDVAAGCSTATVSDIPASRWTSVSHAGIDHRHKRAWTVPDPGHARAGHPDRASCQLA